MHVYTILQVVRNSVFIYEKKTHFEHESFPCITRREKYFFYVFRGAQTVCQLFQENIDLKPGVLEKTLSRKRLMSAKGSDIINTFASECRPRGKYLK